MNIAITSRSVFILLFLLITSAFGQSNSPELWYWQSAYPGNPADVSAIEANIDRAFSYGYTGVAFWSSAFNYMGSTVHPATNVAYMQQLVSYAQAKGMKTMGTVAPNGWSDDALFNNPNWAEGEHLTGSQFTVNSSRTALVPVNGFGGLTNPGFESGLTGWFGFGDGNMGIDPSVVHSGNGSGYVTNAAGNARFKQVLNVLPWHQYHVRVWTKTSNFAGYSPLYVLDPTTNITLFYTEVGHTATQDWTEVEFTFNSRASTQPWLLFGVWGGSSGTIWFDDALMEETSLVYVLRRPGTPLTVYDPANPNTVFQEGTDFNAIADPQLASGGGFSGFYHPPATVTLPSTTQLQAGQTVAMDYYAVQPIQTAGDVGICLTEAAAQDWLRQNAQSITTNMPAGTGYLLYYDEMRHMDSCAVCKARNLTPGQLLASHVNSTANLYHSLAPSAPLYVWGDMFDPFQNAVSNYYYVEGSIAGSWTGLPSTVTILNWNLPNLANSLNWFSGKNAQQTVPYRQIIAGYYDAGDGAAAATQELQQAIGTPGVAGLMYITWGNDYSQLQAFATAAKSNWSTYLSSVPNNATSQISVKTSVVTFNRVTNLYSQTVTLTNQGAALSSAAYVTDSLPAGVAMYQASGVTSAALPAGVPYKEAGPIGAGATVTMTVQFTRTGTSPITYTARILGSGPR